LESFDALYDAKEINFVGAHDERTGTHMADGYARVSGETGVVLAGQAPRQRTCGRTCTEPVSDEAKPHPIYQRTRHGTATVERAATRCKARRSHTPVDRI